MRNRVRTPREFEKELQAAVVAGELLGDDPSYARRGAAASDLLARWLDRGEDVNLIVSAWNEVLGKFRVKYWVGGVPLFSMKTRPVTLARTADR